MSEQQIVEYRAQLDRYGDSFAKVLPAHTSRDKLIRMAESAVRLNERLLSCERGSLMRSIMTGAILGLEIDGVTGQAFLVPFKGKVQLIIGYKGYVTLAWNSRFLLEGEIVRANDRLTYEKGNMPYLNFAPSSPTATAEQRGEVTASFAIARHADSQISTFHVSAIDEIIAARENSSGYKYDKTTSPWTTNFAEMAKKTAIRALADQLPLNVQRAAAIEAKHDETGKAVYLNPESLPEEDAS